MNLYAYADSNPVNRFDPEGTYVLYYGVSGAAFAGLGWSATLGTFFDSNRLETGLYASAGAGYGIDLGFGFVVGFAPSQDALSGKTENVGVTLLGTLEESSSTSEVAYTDDGTTFKTTSDFTCRTPSDDDAKVGTAYSPQGVALSVGPGVPVGAYKSYSDGVALAFHPKTGF